jgi:hypothetical protein
MKNKLALAGFLMFLGLIIVIGAKAVWAVTTTLPRLTTACESKVGLLMGVEDNFSILKKCPGGSRKVMLGEAQVQNDNGQGSGVSSGGIMGSGEIAFISDSQILKNDGTIWEYVENKDKSGQWVEKNNGQKIPVLVTDVLQWNTSSLLTNEGVFYILAEDGSSWIKITAPIVKNP